MDEAQNSGGGLLLSREEKAISELKKEVEMRKREAKVQRGMARKMLDKGYPIAAVVEITGLKKKTVGTLVKKKYK